MTGLWTARVPVSAHAGVFDPVQKVSANPYFNHTTFPPLFAFSALGDQGRAERARLAFGWRKCPSRRTLAVSAPFYKKCRQTRILILLVPPHLFHSAAGAQWGRAGVGEGVAPPTSTGQSGQAMAESRAGSEVPNQPRCGSIESRHTRRELGESGAQRGARRGVRGDALGL